MALKFRISKEEFEGLDESLQGFYEEEGDDAYRLQVEGTDDAKEVREALRKEREEKAAAKARAKELEEAQADAERKYLEEKEDFKTLAQRNLERAEAAEKRESEKDAKWSQREREAIAAEICAKLIDKDATNGVKRHKQLMAEALQYINHTPEGAKINGPEGDAWDSKKLSEFLVEDNPHLVDGSKASGGGAPGSSGGGAVTKKFEQMSGAELSALRKEKPDEYQRLRDEYHSR